MTSLSNFANQTDREFRTRLCSLILAYDWEDSPQGFNYWRDLYALLNPLGGLEVPYPWKGK